MTAPVKVPVTIVTGFLGAGKTTLIRHLLATAGGRRIALVINEFGDVGVDGDILRACGDPACDGATMDGRIVELSNGCLCCTVADDFIPAIDALLAADPRPDHIVVETSGLALPKPLIKAFDWPDIRARLTVDGVVAVVDAAAVAAGRFADDPEAVVAERAADAAIDHDNPLEEVYEDQLAAADLVVLNKVDLLGTGERDAVIAEVTAALPRAARLIAVEDGRIGADVLLGLAAAAEDDLLARPSHHDGLGAHDHDDFSTFAVDVAAADPEALIARLSQVVADHDILRVKGFVEVPGKAMRLLVQGVGGRFRSSFDRPWQPGEARLGRLVVIGQKGIDEAAVRAALA